MIDLDKYKNVPVTLKTRDGEIHTMSQYELGRWFCLIEAIDIIDKKADQIKKVHPESVEANKDYNWVKPIALQKYVDERTGSMLFEMDGELNIKECITSSEHK